MSLKLWYPVAAAFLALFFLAYAAWAVVRWSQGGETLLVLEALVSLAGCFGMIGHAVLYWRRLEAVSIL